MIFPGAFDGVAFPCIAPLAVITRYLNEGELKRCAAALRNSTEKFKSISADNLALISETPLSPGASGEDAEHSVFGPELALPGGSFCEEAGAKTEKMFNKTIIGCFLLPGSGNSLSINQLPPLQPVSFGAAAVANMSLRITCQDGFYLSQWKIGKLHWLPKAK